MMIDILKSLIGSKHSRDLKKCRPYIVKINSYEKQMSMLSLSDIKDQAGKLRKRITNGESMDSLLPESFALAREASHRALGIKHFEVQLTGGIAIYQGKVAEMKTGEGKTLTAVLPAFLRALSGEGVHIITFIDYLAMRDALWMGPLFNSLGMTVGYIQSGMDSTKRKEAYLRDITYGAGKEFGFDYLRDNLVADKILRVQRGLNFAIVDEIDSILIDEATTPLIISGGSSENKDLYTTASKAIFNLEEGKDYEIDMENRKAYFTETGTRHIEDLKQAKGKQAEISVSYGEMAAEVNYVQKAVEERHFRQRDKLNEYDNVLNPQREFIYSLSNDILESDDIGNNISCYINDVIVNKITSIDEIWNDDNLSILFRRLRNMFQISLDKKNITGSINSEPGLIKFFQEHVLKEYFNREKRIGADKLRELEKILHYVLLTLIGGSTF